MFKKTLLAAAIATTASFAADASTVAVTAKTVGVEWAAGKGTDEAATITVTLGRNYASGDIITVTFAGATVVTTDSKGKAIPFTLGGTALANIETAGYKDNAVRVLANKAITKGQTITISGVKLDVAGAKNKAKVTVQAAGKVGTVEGPITVDSSDSVDLITFKQQLATEIATKFDGIVDVEEVRKKFTGAKTEDQLVLKNTNETLTTGVTPNSATYTVYGDFSFLDSNNDGKVDAKDKNMSITASTGTVKIADDLKSVSVKSTSFATGTVGITVKSDGKVTIPDQTFEAMAMVNYKDPKDLTKSLDATTLAKGSAGAWTLNGAKVTVPVMFFRDGYSQSVTVSNTSNQAGSIDLVLYAGDKTKTVEGVATAAAKNVTDISEAVRNAVAAAGLSGEIAFDVIVNAPAKSVEVVALYYVAADKDRLRTR